MRQRAQLGWTTGLARACAAAVLVACPIWAAEPNPPPPPVVSPAPAPAPAKDVPAPSAAAARPVVDPFAAPESAASEPEEVSSLGWIIVRGLVAMCAVMALIYLTLNFGLRRLMGGRALGLGRTLVAIVERVPVDSKHSLLVVKAAGEYLLVGAADSGLSLISKLDAETVERLQREQAQAAPPVSPFLQKLLARRGGPPRGPQGSNP